MATETIWDGGATTWDGGTTFWDLIPDILKIDGLARVLPSRWLASMKPSKWLGKAFRS